MLENIKVMMIGWFYYGIWFMAGSVIVTSLGFPNMGYAMYFNYMPVVFASAMYNFIIFIIRKLKKRLEVK